jgi:uncharacterized membrane protein
MMAFAQIHPLLVPFAVALLVMGVIFEFYGKFQNEESARTAGGFNIRMGLAFAVVAVVVGFLGVIGIGDIISEADPRLSLEVKTRMRKFLSYHILFACSTVVVFILALVAARYRKRKLGEIIYFSLLGVGLVTVLATGYCGGELVHRFGLPAPIQVQ